mgnify:FL=1
MTSLRSGVRMGLMKKLNNENSVYWILGAWIMAFIIFVMVMIPMTNLGLGAGNAIKIALGYTIPTALIAAAVSFLVNKFKFRTTSFHKFWFWILVVTIIARLGQMLSQ